MPQTLEKLKGHIAFATPVRRASVQNLLRYSLKFHIWTPHQKMIDTNIFLSLDYPPFRD